jgi:hypothetical protein
MSSTWKLRLTHTFSTYNHTFAIGMQILVPEIFIMILIIIVTYSPVKLYQNAWPSDFDQQSIISSAIAYQSRFKESILIG